MYSIAETILICILHKIYPRMKKFLSFFGQKKIGQGGSLGKGVWEPTPHLLQGFNKAHLLYSTNKKRKRSILTKLT